MKKKEKLLISLLLFLVVLFFWTRQEIRSNQGLLNYLSNKEVDIYEYTLWNFNDEIKKEISPLMYLSNKSIFDSLTLAKCNLEKVIIVVEKNGGKSIFRNQDNWEQDSIVRMALKGASVHSSSRQETRDYYTKQMTEYYDYFCYNNWSLLFFFLKKTLISILIFVLPLLLTGKIFLLLMAFLIILMPLLVINNYYQGEKKENVKECTFNKAPPSSHCCYNLVIKEYIVPPVLIVHPFSQIKVFFSEEFAEKTKKIINQIFHVPKLLFVLNY